MAVLDEYELVYINVYKAAIVGGNSPTNAKIKAEEGVEDFEAQTNMGDAALTIWVEMYSHEISLNQSRPVAINAGNSAMINLATSFSDLFDRRT